MEKTEKKSAEELKAKIKHLEKLYNFRKFQHEIRYPDMTAGYMNRLINII